MKGLIGKLFISGNILLKTGLHIGGSTEGLDIGGVDVPILRNVNDIPFIPGSSLKGKMRSLLEWRDGRFKITVKLKGQERISFTSIPKFWDAYIKAKKEGAVIDEIKGAPCDCGECNICKLFGVPAQASSITPSRLIVRDAPLDVEEFKKLFRETEMLEREYGEVKFENTIDRITSMANPRQIERVPAGAVFKYAFIVNLYGEGDKEVVDTLLLGMRLLEDDYLGGSGTRGYGQIKFVDTRIFLRTKEYYTEGKEEKLIATYNTLDEVQAIFDKVEQQLKEVDISKQAS